MKNVKKDLTKAVTSQVKGVIELGNVLRTLQVIREREVELLKFKKFEHVAVQCLSLGRTVGVEHGYVTLYKRTHRDRSTS